MSETHLAGVQTQSVLDVACAGSGQSVRFADGEARRSGLDRVLMHMRRTGLVRRAIAERWQPVSRLSERFSAAHFSRFE